MLSNTFSNIIDCMFELNEEQLTKLLADALKRLNEQAVCEEKKVTYKYNPVTFEEKETNKQIYAETQRRCTNSVALAAQIKELDPLHKASSVLFLHYDLKVPLEENQYDIHIRKRTISPKEYIHSHFPDVSFEAAYEEYARVKSSLD